MSRFVWMLMLAESVAVVGCEHNSADPTPRRSRPKTCAAMLARPLKLLTSTPGKPRRSFKRSSIPGSRSWTPRSPDSVRRARPEGRSQGRMGPEVEGTGNEAGCSRAKSAEIGDSSAEAWKDVRKGAQSAYDDLDKAFRDASREF